MLLMERETCLNLCCTLSLDSTKRHIACTIISSYPTYLSCSHIMPLLCLQIIVLPSQLSYLDPGDMWVGICIAGNFMWHLRCLCEKKVDYEMQGNCQDYLRVLYRYCLPRSRIALEMDFSTAWFFSMLAFYGNNKHKNTTFRMHNKKSLAVRG